MNGDDDPIADPDEIPPDIFSASAQGLGDILDDEGRDVLSEQETDDLRDWATDANLRSEEAEASEESVPAPAPPVDKARPSSSLASFGFSPWFLVGVLVVIAAGVAFWLAGGSDGDKIAVDTAGEIIDDDADTGSSPSTTAAQLPQGSGSDTAAPATSATAATPCAAAAEASSTMTFSSPDVGPSISGNYSQGTAYAFGFPTPRFEWTGVPAAATELMITIQKVDSNAGEAVLASTDLDADGWPVGGLRWSASDISPDLTSLPETAFTSGDVPDPALLMLLPEGVVERKTGSATVTIDDVPFDNKFIGPNRDGQVFLFTIYALCEPNVGDPLAYRPAWGRQNAIELAWFAASADGV